MITEKEAIQVYESVMRRKANSPQPLYKVFTVDQVGNAELLLPGSFVFVGDIMPAFDNPVSQAALIRSDLTGFFTRNMYIAANYGIPQIPYDTGIWIFDSLSLFTASFTSSYIQLVLSGWTFTNI